jgi:hypothetical protein
MNIEWYSTYMMYQFKTTEKEGPEVFGFAFLSTGNVHSVSLLESPPPASL